MSGSPTQPPPSPPLTGPQSGYMESQASSLGPGIADLIIQGIESGLVFSQFSQWFYTSQRSESSLLLTVVVFVTVMGLAQSGACFALAWSTYVRHFGEFLPPHWSDYISSIPTIFMSVPVQALMIWRCYHNNQLVGRNLFIITPLVLLLVASIIMSIWSTVSLIQYANSVEAKEPGHWIGSSWLYLVSILLPSVLDLALTGISLHYLMRTMKQVYAPHSRKQISRLANLVWQSALPPTLCTICACAIYIQFGISHRADLEYWPKTIQAMIGKLYVLSLFYMINAQPLGGPLQPDQQPTAFTSTFTVPAEVLCTLTQDSRVGNVACSEFSVGHGPTWTVEVSV